MALGVLSGREEQGLILVCQTMPKDWKCCTVGNMITGEECRPPQMLKIFQLHTGTKMVQWTPHGTFCSSPQLPKCSPFSLDARQRQAIASSQS